MDDVENTPDDVENPLSLTSESSTRSNRHTTLHAAMDRPRKGVRQPNSGGYGVTPNFRGLPSPKSRVSKTRCYIFFVGPFLLKRIFFFFEEEKVFVGRIFLQHTVSYLKEYDDKLAILYGIGNLYDTTAATFIHCLISHLLNLVLSYPPPNLLPTIEWYPRRPLLRDMPLSLPPSNENDGCEFILLFFFVLLRHLRRALSDLFCYIIMCGVLDSTCVRAPWCAW